VGKDNVPRRVIIIGLDSAPPELLFGRMLDRMPNLKRMVEQGLHGPLRSCDPPITVPAWQVMSTSASPGRLGLYGFRHRKGHSYTEGWTPNSYSVRLPRIWDVLARHDKRSCLVGVPPGYPPKPMNGWSVSCFLTPPNAEQYTYPAELRGEIEELVGSYQFDVKFRVEDRDTLREELFQMTEKRFDVVRYLATEMPWDFFMMVEIGVDRLGHAFWKYFDPEHPGYVPDNPYESVADEYYELIDERLGELMELLEDAVFLVVSDHGSKAMHGAFCINEWLIERGYLALNMEPEGVVALDKASVDWSRTKAWGWGGYYARIFLNVEGRESEGVIPQGDYEQARAELAEELQEITHPDGREMEVRVFRPEDLYSACLGNPPDLMVYFDDLHWRSAGTIGHDGLYLSENDTGPDDSVHAMDGIFVLFDPTRRYGQSVTGLSLLDVAPTVLELMGVPVPEGMEGHPLAAPGERAQSDRDTAVG
jgi:predicted AlkP superfamily phosphohydrolase/phosphomutase